MFASGIVQIVVENDEEEADDGVGNGKEWIVTATAGAPAPKPTPNKGPQRAAQHDGGEDDAHLPASAAHIDGDGDNDGDSDGGDSVLDADVDDQGYIRESVYPQDAATPSWHAAAEDAYDLNDFDPDEVDPDEIDAEFEYEDDE